MVSGVIDPNFSNVRIMLSVVICTKKRASRNYPCNLILFINFDALACDC